ncbi:lipopolysaccharide biosynthesis protein [Lacimicrobium alkaliphilum]|uniref:Lipopolysaccharide biosynthesis protein n=1 Tax=Lacimicrobium alkaliphilum TaxID=1526571 RepID=A0A0U3AMR5_9ALTE|nr:lipopolysaccharide biosynthesis protein [Lacimicrobium alkaliphilum]ALS99266.1 lipopolysaccharide biosynthesis protein [Lacimicrobium alkaliphilum]
MTQHAQHELEARLKAYKQEKLAAGDWLNHDILMAKAEKLEYTDPALALRVFQRARVLNPDSKEAQQKIASLNRELKKSNPEVMRSSSKEADAPETVSDAMESAQEVSEPAQAQVPTFTERLVSWLKKPISICVLMPFLLFAFYQVIWASDRFESQAQLIVQQPNGMATLEPAMAMLSGFTGGSGSSDTSLVEAFIYSTDLVEYLQQELDIFAHYNSDEYDIFSRLSASASREDKLDYFKKRVVVEVDQNSKIITVRVQGYTPEFAKTLTETIVDRAEWYINKVGHDLAKAQLAFVQNEHAMVEERLQKAKSEILAFQRKYNLLDPEAEGMALQQIAYGLEAQIANKQAELRALRSSMSESAPMVMQLKEQLDSLRQQLIDERQRLTQDIELTDVSGEMGVNEILANFGNLRMDLEFAVEALASSQVSLEKSRIEAYRQLKYLVVVESPTLPEEAKYPSILYNLSLFLAVILMIFGIGSIIRATVNELQ